MFDSSFLLPLLRSSLLGMAGMFTFKNGRLVEGWSST